MACPLVGARSRSPLLLEKSKFEIWKGAGNAPVRVQGKEGGGETASWEVVGLMRQMPHARWLLRLVSSLQGASRLMRLAHTVPFPEPV